MKEYTILGVKVNGLSYNQVLKLIERYILIKKPRQLVTANPEFVMAAQKDHEFRETINGADLVVADGIGLVWAIKLIYGTKIQKITGVDLIDKIAELAAQRGYTIFFLGAKDGIAKKASEVLGKKYPNLKTAGTYCGWPELGLPSRARYDFPFDVRITDIKKGHKDLNWEIISQVRAAKPDILLVAYGHPKQEKFIARYKRILNVPVMMGVGGAFDFLSGHASRAPKWLQNLGLEWFWRLIHEPWRWKRIYSAVIKFSLNVLYERIKLLINKTDQ